MKRNYFVSVKPNITDNAKLRIPQKEGYLKIQEHYSQSDNIRETGIVLPVGCGKSGLITLAPFALGSNRVLVIAPGLRIKKQLAEDFNVSSPMMFYQKCSVINGKLPTSSIIEGRNTNIHDLNDSDVVITNIQQIQGDENKWLMKLPRDFFDCIVVDEAHHNIASSWDRVREHFSEAKIINLSATPVRADGKVMAGKIIYTFSIVEAIKCGYVKQLKAKILSPATLKYIRSENGQEIEVAIDEIRRLGEEDSRFRRGIVSSPETLNTIIDCSIRELFDMRQRTGDNRHKIIASALNHEHCIQITEAYKARDLRAEYIHSQEDSVTNEKILEKLENNQLDVIVQVKMLGEGFDHPYLSIAAVCSIFSNLAPFAQFVGRIMRVIDQNSPTSPNNQGVVICHAGGNIARRWEDFRSFSKADQEFFDQFLLPIEELDFTYAEELEYTPGTTNGDASKIDIVEQEDVYIKELDLYKDNQEVQEALRVLKNNGLDVILKPIQVSPQKQRLASKRALDDHIKHLTGVLLQKQNVSHDGKTLDKSYIKTNFAFIKSLIDSKCNEFLGIKKGQRSEISLEQIQSVENELDRIIEKIEVEAFNGTA